MARKNDRPPPNSLRTFKNRQVLEGRLIDSL